MKEKNKKIISDFFEYFNDGNIESAFALVSDNVAWWVPGHLPFSGTKTKSEYLKIVAAIGAGFPGGFQLILGEMTAEDDRVPAEAESSGTHVNGKTYNNKYHFLFHIQNGLITQVKEYMDTQHLKDLIG